MAKKNILTAAPPYRVEQAIKRLGANLRTARLRRNLTIDDVAEKIGTGSRAVSAAEQGKITAGIATYTALLWAYDILDSMSELANPAEDREGLALESKRERASGNAAEELSNDF